MKTLYIKILAFTSIAILFSVFENTSSEEMFTLRVRQFGNILGLLSNGLLAFYWNRKSKETPSH